MSAMTTGAARTLAMPLRSPVSRAAPRKTAALRLVPQRHSSAAKAPFVVVVVALLVGGLLGLLLLNTLVAQDSFALHDLGKQAKALEQQEQDLARQVQALQAPGELASRATALGMVPGGPPAFLRLSDGKVLGQPTAGVAPVAPPVTTSTASNTKVTTLPGNAPAGTTPGTGPHGSTTWTGPRQSPRPTPGQAATKTAGAPR
jgi:hypothetical protein